MSSDTRSHAIPKSSAPEVTDDEQLQKARDRKQGLPAGRLLQPPPMLFTPDGHNLSLGDLYRDRAAFLICAGPSLKQLDLDQLNQRGCLTMAVNNAAALFRPQLWCCVDDAHSFCDAIWRDPGILKFVPLGQMDSQISVRDENGNLTLSEERVREMPAVVGFRRNGLFVAEQWLYEESFNWGNDANRLDADGHKGTRSVMYVALKLLFYLGVRRVFLLGCDFRMNNQAENYAFPQNRSRLSVRGNNRSYRVLNRRLECLKPYFDAAGFQVLNCTPESGLTAFPYLPFEEALGEVRARMPSEIITSGMYEWKPPDQGNRK